MDVFCVIVGVFCVIGVVVAGISILAVVVAWAGAAVRVISGVDVVVSGMLILAIVVVAFSVGGFVALDQAEILTGRTSTGIKAD